MGRWTRRRRTAVVLGALLVCTTHGAATAGPDELGLEHAATAPGLMRRLMGRAFGGHEPYGMPHVNLHIDLSKVPFWPKHFNAAATVPWDQFMECLILEHVGEQLFTRPAVQQLAPYIDANGDEQVSHDEFTAFVRNFGGVDDSRETLQKAIQAGLVKIGEIHDDGQAGGGCALSLQRRSSEYLELLASGNLQFAGTAPFTIELWVMPQATTKVLTIMSKYNRGKWGQYMVRLEPGGAVFFHREVAPWGLKTAEALAPGAWHHIAAVYKDGWSSVYVNGTVWATQKEGAQDNNPETAVLIGALLEKGKPMDFFDGMVDEIRLWSVARSQDELRSAMHLALSGSEDGLAGYWPLDECAGQRAHDRRGAHDALLHGGTWVHSPIQFASYKDRFGCIDVLC